MSDLLPARVRVPCSTSNLGSGYDTIGLALDRYLEVSFDPTDGDLRVIRAGTLASIGEPEGDDLVAVSFSRALAAAGLEPGGTLRLTSDIPVARGLGSSAAAVLAGFDLALAARGLARDDTAALGWARDREGHADNATPCLLGGLRAALPGPVGPHSIPLDLSPDIGFAYAAPAAGISTQVARDALPKLVAHETATRSVARVTALVRGLETGDADLLKIGIEDELHVPHRLPMIPGAYNALGAGYDAGAWAITISGAGSGLIALCEPARANTIASAMREVFGNGDEDPECVGFAVHPDFKGLTRLEG